LLCGGKSRTKMVAFWPFIADRYSLCLTHQSLSSDERRSLASRIVQASRNSLASLELRIIAALTF